MHTEPEETCEVCCPPKPAKKVHKILVTIELEANGEMHGRTMDDVKAILETMIEMHNDMTNHDEESPQMLNAVVKVQINNKEK